MGLEAEQQREGEGKREGNDTNGGATCGHFGLSSPCGTGCHHCGGFRMGCLGELSATAAYCATKQTQPKNRSHRGVKGGIFAAQVALASNRAIGANCSYSRAYRGH